MSKNVKKLSVVFSMLGVLASFGVVDAQTNAGRNSQFKNLAGEAHEISAMRLPAPETLGTRSKAAVIAIEEGRSEYRIPHDGAENFKLMILTPNADAPEVEIALPNGEFAAGKNIGNLTKSSFGLDGAQLPADVYEFGRVESGEIRVRLGKNAPPASSVGGKLGFIVASSETPYRLYSYINTNRTIVGEPLGIVSKLFDVRANNERGDPTSLNGNLQKVSAQVTAPDDSTFETTLFDDGAHADGAANDGVFGANFIPTQSGAYRIHVVAEGFTNEGAEILRTDEILVQSFAGSLNIRGAVSTNLTADGRWRINIPVNSAKVSPKAIVYAELWQRNEQGELSPVNWFSGMSYAETSGKRSTGFPLTLDARWLNLAKSDAKSFELRNIRIQEPDNFVTIAETESLALPDIYLPEEAKARFTGEIDDEMRQGKKPSRTTSSAVGGKLMLVHGYCSGDAWGNQSQFTDYVKFLDLGQNRTHDQFAQRIANFGASLPSFGIIAHSQGGAASLHLYNYYWSGLDYATGNRLIQSVGTPYQGTSLAGNLAALASLFGGCGSNYDLTYNGAAAWLAGISASSRAKVFYHTTSDTKVWWRIDYCHIATDAFLGEPEDGVVERAYAQLPYGNNLGHKTGWCHISGMRDPAQTTDSSRNSNMNAYAAR